MNDALDIFMKLARIVPIVAFSLFSLPVAQTNESGDFVITASIRANIS